MSTQRCTSYQGGAPRCCMSMATAYREGGGGSIATLACRFVEPKNDVTVRTHPAAMLSDHEKCRDFQRELN